MKVSLHVHTLWLSYPAIDYRYGLEGVNFVSQTHHPLSSETGHFHSKSITDSSINTSQRLDDITSFTVVRRNSSKIAIINNQLVTILIFFD